MERLKLDFGTVSREIRNVVARRRELLIFLGSLFAGTSLFLQRVLDGELPESFRRAEDHAFLIHSLMVLIPCAIIALRVSKLHAGLIINGVFYRRLEAAAGEAKGTLFQASQLNVFGMSASFFWLVAVMAAAEAGVLTLALGRPWYLAVGAGAGALAALAFVFAAHHMRAARFAVNAAERAETEEFGREDLEDHWSESRSDVNHDLIALNGFAGLMLFSTLENITGLGKIGADHLDLAAADIQRFGPIVYSALLALVCIASVVIYLRLAVAIARFSLRIDPSDRPFRPFKFTDTYLGYLLIVFFLFVACRLLAASLPSVNDRAGWGFATVAAIGALVAYPVVQLFAARK